MSQSAQRIVVMVLEVLKGQVSEGTKTPTIVKTRRTMLVEVNLNRNGRKIVNNVSLYSTLNQMLNVLHCGLLKKTWLQ